MTERDEFEKMMEDLAKAIREEGGAKPTSQLDMLKEAIPLALEEVEQIEDILDQVIDKIGPKLAKYIKQLQDFAIDSRIKVYKAYVGAGMSSAEAVSLIQTDVHNTSMAVREAFKKIILDLDWLQQYNTFKW